MQRFHPSDILSSVSSASITVVTMAFGRTVQGGAGHPCPDVTIVRWDSRFHRLDACRRGAKGAMGAFDRTMSVNSLHSERLAS